MSDALFVYGSLRSEFDNPHARGLREKADLLGRATVRGSIFLVGQYPGFKSEPDGVVHGEVYKLRDPESTLAALDAYEGPEYPRTVISTSIPDVSAWIYIYPGSVRADQRILSGDFLAQ
jgi:gamma-glutamylcyclotransferase (GGCT)/AIG2-like uncharacterized protein YtfP